jgi:three-Cys-motif partner protein
MDYRSPALDDDGLITPEIGDWGEEKYRLVSTFATMFTTAMKDKWQHLVYIDLFAGAARARIKNTKRIIAASPLLALNIPHKFDLYIFCEKDASNFAALKERVAKDYAYVESRFLQGDANDLTGEILHEMPKPKSGMTALGFCFADPFALENLSFETIRQLASRFMDFLVLVPTGMDAIRNVSRYLNPSNPTVGRFLGMHSWRKEWTIVQKLDANFGNFIMNTFGNQMTKIEYIYEGIKSTHQVRSTDRNLPLYRLAFFSRNKLGAKFWKETKKYSDDQLDLPL